jgi:hypothetical protein
MQNELLRCLSSFNVDRAKIESLREEVRIAENEQRERIRKATEDRERERKVINYSILIDDDFYTSSSRVSLTRAIFEKWVADNKVLHSEDGSTVCTFEELVEGKVTSLSRKC